MIKAFITALLAVFLAFLSRREKNHSYFLLLAFVLLTSFLSLGYYWGNDVPTYEEWFESITNSGVPWWDFSSYDTFVLHDYGFVFIYLICKPLGFWGMRAVVFIIENAIVYRFIIKHVDRRWYWLAVFIYVFNPNFWALGSSMMRQWMAMCIVLYGADFLLEKKYIKYVVCVLIAASIHVSSLICMLLLPLSFLQQKTNIKRVVAFISIIVAYWILSPIFIDYVGLFLRAEELYMDYTDIHGSVGISNVGQLIIYTLLLYSSVKTKQRDGLFNWIVMLYSLILPLLSLGELSSRLGLYFTLFSIGIYPLYMGNPNIQKSQKTIIVTIVCAYLIYSFFVFFTSSTYNKYFGTYNTLIGI